MENVKVKSFNSCIASTSTPNASTAPVNTCARATSMPNVSVIERSTSLPTLVSDASIADLQSNFKSCGSHKDETFIINTMHFFGSPKHCPSKQFAGSSCPEDITRTDCPSKASLNNFFHKDLFKICRPKESPWIRVPKKSPKTVSIKESITNLPNEALINCVKDSPIFQIPTETVSTKISPKSSPPHNASRSGTSKDSLTDFLGEDLPRTGLLKDPFKICLPKKTPNSSTGTPRSCLLRAPCNYHSQPKKTKFEDDNAKCSELLSSDDEKEMEVKSECFEELYFNAQAKKTGGSAPRVPNINEQSSVIVKVEPADSTDSNIHKEHDANLKSEYCNRVLKDSGTTSSLADSRATSATCDASASYYQNKLLATLQILQNKEQTISIQAESLAVAEERIATLNQRAHELKKELDRRTHEYSILRKSVESKAVQKTDVCVVTDRPMEDQRDIVNTLENNLCVIEDLYRECFYETAKQENLIEMLRSSYLEVRLMDKQKADQIGRLQTVINTQQWSLDRCQDIALEVDGLKMEISNFLNSSSSTNNDSGMWERSEESYAAVPGALDDLQYVRELLLKLQDLLALDCCQCDTENKIWKKKAEDLEIKIAGLRERFKDLECNLSSKWEEADLKCNAEVELKEQELARIKEQLIRSENCSREQSSAADAISMQLEQTKALLSEKTTEVTQLRKEKETQANKIQDLQEELAKADHVIKENYKMRSEVSYLSSQVSMWRAQLDAARSRARALETDLTRTKALAAHVDTCYREKVSNVAELEAQLESAHSRGTALCGEARRAVGAVRVWMRRMRDKNRELENLRKEKDSYIAVLQRRLEENQNNSQVTRASDNTASCSKWSASQEVRTFCSKCRKRWEKLNEPSVNEMPSCSSTPAPIRLRRKSGNKPAAWVRDASLQQPVRQDTGCDASSSTGGDAVTCECCSAGTCACAGGGVCGRRHDVRHVRISLERASMQRSVSPAEQLLQRVEQLSEALADGNRRWTRTRHSR